MPTENCIKCLVIDDEFLATTLLNSYINREPGLQLIGSTTNAIEALAILKETPVDLLFLDIQMPELNGIEILKAIAGKNIQVILTTAFREYALEGYEYHVVDYLLKPVTFERFRIAAAKAIERIAGSSLYACAGEIFIKAAHQLRKISYNDIIFMESLGDYVAFHCVTGKLVSLDTLKQLQSKLPAQCFVRIHRSYIINRKFIKGMSGGSLLVGTRELPVGNTYREALKKILE